MQVPVLADISWRGQQKKAMLWANRNGFFYVLDRRTGEFLQATAIAKQNWNAGFDAKGQRDLYSGTPPPGTKARSFTRAIRARPTGSIRPTVRGQGCST